MPIPEWLLLTCFATPTVLNEVVSVLQSQKLWFYLDFLHLSLREITARTISVNIIMLFLPLMISHLVDTTSPSLILIFGPPVVAGARALLASATVARHHWPSVAAEVILRAVPVTASMERLFRVRTRHAPRLRASLVPVNVALGQAAAWGCAAMLAFCFPHATADTLVSAVCSPWVIAGTVLAYWIPLWVLGEFRLRPARACMTTTATEVSAQAPVAYTAEDS